MTPSHAYPLFARLRASSRWAALVLLVFALKLGSAAACAQHDFADLGLGGETSTIGLLDVADAAHGDPPGPNSLSHLGACSHCGSHHASAVTGNSLTTAVEGSALVADCYAPPTFTLAANPELRPPIA